MIGLLLDSSDKYLTVGLTKGNVLIDSCHYEAWQRQSELMVAEIDKLLKANKISPKMISFVASSKGPGSYTGVRIALTIAKIISLALGCPLYLVSSLEILQKRDHVCVCLSNARSKRSYFGVYEGSNVIVEDTIKTNSEVLEYLTNHPAYLACGNFEYLGLQPCLGDIFDNFLSCINEEHLCKDPLTAKPIYLKDVPSKDSLHCIVRKTIPSDLNQIVEISNSSFTYPYTQKQLEYELYENPLAHFYSAVIDSEVVGFIIFMITFNSAPVVLLAVKESYRRKGVASLMLNQLFKDCASQKEAVEFVTLEVRASNRPAIEFYKKNGFEEALIKKDFYEDGEDAIYMVRSLING